MSFFRNSAGSLLVILFCLFGLDRNLEAEGSRLTVSGDEILQNGEPVKIIGLRCSNALISDATTDDLIDVLDLYQNFGVNTVSVFVMGSRFGDVKGYLPDGSLDPVYRNRLERILGAMDDRGMITIVGCLYWGTSRAKEELLDWAQEDANRAIANTARWLGEKGFRNVILDPDNEGMARREMKWDAEAFILAAKAANPNLVVANNTRQTTSSEDLNMHFGPKVAGKPWFDSESTPKDGVPVSGYWSTFSKQSHMEDDSFYNYSRIGRYTDEMKTAQRKQTLEGMNDFNGIVLASTWLQCAPNEGIEGPFTSLGGYSNLGSSDDLEADWNQDIDQVYPDAGIRWWMEHVQENF